MSIHELDGKLIASLMKAQHIINDGRARATPVGASQLFSVSAARASGERRIVLGFAGRWLRKDRVSIYFRGLRSSKKRLEVTNQEFQIEISTEMC